jgi:hypothetical protein
MPVAEERTIHRRCLFCLVENRGARICFEGRSQTIVECVSCLITEQRVIGLCRLTQHRRMQPIRVWYQNRWGQDYQQDMREKEVGAPEGHFDNLDDEFTRRLRHGGGSQASPVPFSSPPSTVSLIVLVFAGQESRDQDFLDGPLDCNNRDDT